MNYSTGPSRPPPIPYDDPYSDPPTSITTDGDGGDGGPFNTPRNITGRHDSVRLGSMGIANSDPGPWHHNTRGRGRGGSRGRQSDRGRRGRGKGTPQHSQRHPSFTQRGGSHHSPGLTSPDSFGHPYSQQPGYAGTVGEWSYGAPLVTPPPPAFGFGLQNTLPGVQPHINPRFANQLGFGFSQMSQVPQMSPGAGSPPTLEQYHPGDANLGPATGYHPWEEESG